MTSTWIGCNSLTSFPLINTSSVTNLNSAWRDCTSLTTLDLDFGITMGNVGNMLSTWFNCPLSTVSYDALLVDLEAVNSNGPLTLTANLANYTLGSAADTARTALINDHSWTINDAGGI